MYFIVWIGVGFKGLVWVVLVSVLVGKYKGCVLMSCDVVVRWGIYCRGSGGWEDVYGDEDGGF